MEEMEGNAKEADKRFTQALERDDEFLPALNHLITSYMEQRREVFWNEGYHIRRLNQAYFAFYGAYADEPGGPAGEDPVGEAVRELWARLQSPAEFLQEMAKLRDFAELQELLTQTPTTP